MFCALIEALYNGGMKSGKRLTTWNWLRARFVLWSARIHRHYGIVYSDPQEFASAVDAYGRALAIDPTLHLAYFERGKLLWRELAESRGALRDFNAALKLRPGWPEATFCRGLAHQSLGDLSAAISDLNDYISSGERRWREDARRQLELIHLLQAEISGASR